MFVQGFLELITINGLTRCFNTSPVPQHLAGFELFMRRGSAKRYSMHFRHVL
jgi:hypothetical protein